jgi:hypothetical protein
MSTASGTTSPTGRNLNAKQHAKLDRMAEGLDPEAIVTGWSEDQRGPFITLGNGEEKVLSSTGFLRIRTAGMQ